MNNEEAKKNSKSEVSDHTLDDKKINPVVPNSTDPQDSSGTSRSPGKDRGGDRSVEEQNKDRGGDRSIEAQN